MKSTILHIPHSSKRIPKIVRNQFLLSDDELKTELIAMTDYRTDDLFGSFVFKNKVVSNVSRLVVDVERFPEDRDEPMSKIGMGAIYYNTSELKQLRKELNTSEKKMLMEKYYYSHHKKLYELTNRLLKRHKKVMIIDCHSFPSTKLPYEQSEGTFRPDICIGSDKYHTPVEIKEFVINSFAKKGYLVSENEPFSGALVPLQFYEKNKNVFSIMIEINRRLYMNEKNGRTHKNYSNIKNDIKKICLEISEQVCLTTSSSL